MRAHMATTSRGERRLQLHELLQVVVVERVRLAEAASGIELVVPDLSRRTTLLEEQHYGLHAGALERATRTIEDGVQVTSLKDQLAQRRAQTAGLFAQQVSRMPHVIDLLAKLALPRVALMLKVA